MNSFQSQSSQMRISCIIIRLQYFLSSFLIIILILIKIPHFHAPNRAHPQTNNNLFVLQNHAFRVIHFIFTLNSKLYKNKLKSPWRVFSHRHIIYKPSFVRIYSYIVIFLLLIIKTCIILQWCKNAFIYLCRWIIFIAPYIMYTITTNSSWYVYRVLE